MKNDTSHETFYNDSKKLFMDSPKDLANLLISCKNECNLQSGLFDEDQDIEEVFKELFNLIENRISLYYRWIREENGKERIICTPKPVLRKFIDNWLMYLIKKSPLHEKCHGGECGWSPKKV